MNALACVAIKNAVSIRGGVDALAVGDYELSLLQHERAHIRQQLALRQVRLLRFFLRCFRLRFFAFMVKTSFRSVITPRLAAFGHWKVTGRREGLWTANKGFR